MAQDFFFILKTLSFSEVDSHYKSTNECICIELHIIDLKKESSLNRMLFSILMKNGGKDSRVQNRSLSFSIYIFYYRDTLYTHIHVSFLRL